MATFVKIVSCEMVFIALGFVFVVRARRDAEVAGLGVDRVEPPVVADAHPRDVVADGPDLPALEALGRDHHREVRLAARARERGRDVRHLAFGRLDAEDEHVLGEPALPASEVAADAERQALLAEEHVAAVAAADAPDRVVLREVADVSSLRVFPGPLPDHREDHERQRHGNQAQEKSQQPVVDQRRQPEADEEPQHHRGHGGHHLDRRLDPGPDPRRGEVAHVGRSSQGQRRGQEHGVERSFQGAEDQRHQAQFRLVLVVARAAARQNSGSL